MQREETFWKHKLMAFLHDPPCKCFDIAGHGARAQSFLGSAGIGVEELTEFAKTCDRTASAADRFPFPDHQTSGLRSSFDGSVNAPFRHPLGGASWAVQSPLPTADLAEELFQVSIGGVPRELDWRRKFFLYWRRWPEESARKDARLAYLPADTRIPDHTIWSHMSLTSALQGCVQPGAKSIDAAFLMFQFGPVQEFIGAARRTRDFLAGSYLLGWLSAHALKVVADLRGPDSVIFPSLRGQPIFDALYREELYEGVLYGESSLWARMGYSAAQLLSPTLPNRFLAVVPASEAAATAEAAAKAIEVEWDTICGAAWEGFAKLAAQVGCPPDASWRKRWQGQTRGYWKTTWQTWVWQRDVPVDANLRKVEQLATQVVPEKHRDAWYFERQDVRNGKLNNIGFFWPAQVAQVSRLLAMRRNTREFDQFFTDDSQVGARKDALSGKEESIGSEALWKALSTGTNNLFKDNEGPYGAVQIVKRLFLRDDPMPYLKNRLGLSRLPHLFDAVDEVSARNDDQSPYVAILAMDGDSMGEFMAGEKTPPLMEQFSAGAQAYFGALVGFDKTIRRPLSPSYHLQFSEALANFATRFAGPTVDSFGGQLIYAGGDDVLAMLPADKAVACALALRACFRGVMPALLRDDARIAGRFEAFAKRFEFHAASRGWVTPANVKESYPLMVPGPATDISCGIAIAHRDHPLQAIIRAAQSAEKRAKQEFGRAALAVALLKRGGETVHWGCKWAASGQNGNAPETQPALLLYHRYLSFRQAGQVSSRFPYALAELLAPYDLESHRTVDGLNVRELILKELETPLERQCSNTAARAELRTLCHAYIEQLETGYFTTNEARQAYVHAHDGAEPPTPWQDFAKLFLTAAFIDRERKER